MRTHYRPQLTLPNSGLGIGTSVTALLAHGIETTVVEIDPVVHEFAGRYFGLPSNHTPIIEDAVTFVATARNQERRYRYIIHDVFTGGAEPASLFTADFIAGLRDLLTSDGVIAIVSSKSPLYLNYINIYYY